MLYVTWKELLMGCFLFAGEERIRLFCGKAGVVRARKTGQWPVFTEQRAGRPWAPLTPHRGVIHPRPVRIPSSLFRFTKMAAHLW